VTKLSLLRFDSRVELDAALAVRLREALTARGASAVMLAGGSTPLPAYRTVARQMGAHDDRLHVLFSDDRYVAADTTASNYFQSRPLLDVLGLPGESLLRVNTQLPLPEAAADYDRRLSAMLGSGVHVGLGLLGLGADGHTASLFTHADLQRARGCYAISVQRPDGLSAVSVTPELITTIAEPLFVLAGHDKNEALSRMLAQDDTLVAWRAVQGCPQVELWVCP
jgi:6-phosphogluconolactonase